MKSKIVLLLVFGLVFWSDLAALDLKQTLENAYEGNAQIKRQRQVARSVIEELHQARGGWLPNLEAASSVGAADSRSTAPFFRSRNIEKKEYFDGQLIFTQPIWLGGKTFSEVKGAKQRIKAARFELDYAEQTGLLESAVAYLNVIQNIEIVTLSQNSLGVLESHRTATQDNFKVGQATRTDVAQATARVAAARAQVVAAEGILEASKAGYLEIVGSDFREQLAKDDTQWIESLFPSVINNVENKMSSQNPLLLAVITYEEAARINVDIKSIRFIKNFNK